ncbi:Tandem-95 repeat protein [Balamuthia mandrillaris]
MKTSFSVMPHLGSVLLLLFCIFSTSSLALQAPDLPDPASNLQTIAAGSLIIPMDTLQGSGKSFNTKTYGLAIRLLHADIPLLWAIRAGKGKDEADFTATTHEIHPSTGASALRSFYAGPFIIQTGFKEQALDIIQDSSWSHGVKVHELDADTQIDIRHIVAHKPKAFLSDVGGKVDTQVPILQNAGLIEDVHYHIIEEGEEISDLNSNSCYTIMIEPHYEWNENEVEAYYQAVRTFVSSGGNFLAECAGIESYENYDPDSGEGGFVSKYGIVTNNVGNLVLTFPNPDLPVAQFLGTIDGSNSGHTRDYYLASTAAGEDEDDLWQNNGHSLVANDPTAQAYQGRTLHITVGAKIGERKLGHMAWYLGSHTWKSDSDLMMGGKRILLNAILTPAERPSECGNPHRGMHALR